LPERLHRYVTRERTHEEEPVQTAEGDFAAKDFGAWLRAERVSRGIDPQIIADALRVDLKSLALMEAGRVEIPASQRRRAEAALARAAS
jgi:hypothetical protein